MDTPIKNTKNTITERLQQQLDFIAEVDKLKHILRRTLLIDGSRQENDAEHSWHLALAAIVLKEYARIPITMERVLKMVIVHDLVEIYAGDTFAFDTEGNKNKVEREQNAANILFSQLPTDLRQEIRTLWEEFDQMNTDDSLFAASLDRLQPFFHNIRTGGHTWLHSGINEKQVLKRMNPVKTGIPALWPWVLEQIEVSIKEGWIKQ